ncbi:MAG: superoxide reductase [Coriobacteriia bacterium]|nr:superoxide reductase [Coriobacteriia bacterium]MBN2839559.1 superoxide reductase [Coriobacteriia bacterium]
MSDAPILEPLNLVADFDAAGDFEKKHTPFIVVEQADDGYHLSVTVGHEVAHPNQPDHWIGWIELLVGDAAVARFDLAPMVTAPVVSVVLDVEAGTVVRAIEHCNLHGLWASEVTL